MVLKESGGQKSAGKQTSDPDMRMIITNGKRIMPAWGKRLTDDEIVLVIDYVKTLKK